MYVCVFMPVCLCVYVCMCVGRRKGSVSLAPVASGKKSPSKPVPHPLVANAREKGMAKCGPHAQISCVCVSVYLSVYLWFVNASPF